ncbi:MAG TPA: SDR family NAD(P)-dependent oxidoreductase, partial [Kofleriaceae bacterium]|nr:SDR family NAD(P)-dependent oxidoreductase [Kofleriaceae bacterium]
MPIVVPAVVPIVISGKTEAALAAQAAQLRAHLVGRPELALVDVAYTLVIARTQFDHRAALIASDRDAVLDALAHIAHGRPAAGAVVGTRSTDGKLAVLFTGQGSQRPGMGKELYRAFPVFRDALDAACAELDAGLERPLRDVLFADDGSDDAARLDQTVFTQTALFALELALFRLVSSWGVTPDLLAGHSIGELVAAHVAGVLSLADACALVGARARLMQALPPGGHMVTLQASDDEVRDWLARRGAERAEIAAINGPASIVVSGDPEPVAAVQAHFAALGRKTSRLRVSHAFHSHHMDGMCDDFAQLAQRLTYHPPRIPIVSTLTGRRADGDELASPTYWVRQLRHCVRFADSVRTLHAGGARSFLELGPGGVLSALAHEILSDDPAASALGFVPALRKGRPEVEAITAALGALHVRGSRVDWDALFELHGPHRRVDLPTYAFQRQRFWLDAPRALPTDVTAAGLASADHPLLGAAVALADSDGYLFTGRLSLADQPWLAGHQVFGTVIVPGTAWLELALVAAHRVGLDQVEELTLEAPLALPAHGAVQVQIAVGAPDDTGRRSLTLYARPDVRPDQAADDAAAPWTRHATGTLAPAGELADAAFELATWPPPGATPLALDGFYDRLAAAGLGYGAPFQGLRAVWAGGDALFAEVALPDELARDAARFALHPALLDAALHALAVEPIHHASDVALPFSWTGVVLQATGATTLRVRFARTADRSSAALEIADATGAPVARIAALTSRPASADELRSAAAPGHDGLLRMAWTELSGSAPAPSHLRGAVIGPAGGPERADHDVLISALQASGSRFERHADLDALARAAAPPDVLLVPFLSPALASAPAPADVIAHAHQATARALDVLQRWLADERLAASRLVVVTRGAVAAGPDDDVPDLVHAPLWGLVRSAQTENPDRAIHLVDLDDTGASRAALAGALDAAEPQLALRAGRRLVPRLARARAQDALALPGTAAWRLDIASPGTFDRLALVAHPDPLAPLGDGQVRVAVRAAGLNFRDVLSALGMYPGDPGPLGGEGAGVVLDVGLGVTTLAPGDRVLGLVPAAFGPVAIADHRLLARIPAGWSFIEAAAVPVVFLTAWYGLVELARLRPGERVLIHAAAGGVGTAAVQIAQHLGAEVFATASPGKWDALRALGLDPAHIASSRTLDFEPQFLAATGGRGVDVVLDSLAREFVDASLRLLPRGGRFIEMGKTDVRDPDTVAAAHPGVAYRAFDLAEAGTERIAQMLGELLALLARGVLRPPPITAWDLRAAPRAFRAMAQARHAGKHVLTVPRPIDPDGTVLITGGTGTLGALVARHLVRAHRVHHLVLASRQGPAAPGAAALQGELEAAGACVTLAACDAADRDALAALLAAIPVAHPLTAVIHTAAVLDDGIVPQLTSARLAPVLRAKLDAAVHLDALTRPLELSAFVVFSSIAGVLGSPAQASYAAANAFLDAIAHHRTARGLPALAIDWGYWAQKTGLTAHLSHADLGRMTRGGVRPLSSDDGLALLDDALARPDAALVAARFDLRALGAHPDALPPAL